jgi:hypothetical protein
MQSACLKRASNGHGPFNDLVGAGEKAPRRVMPLSTQIIGTLIQPPFTPLLDRSCEQGPLNRVLNCFF